jgi:hypothetical protein
MASGNNEAFLRDPKEYIRTQVIGSPSQALQAGQMQIDLVPIDRQNPQFVRMENYAMRPVPRETKHILAWYLPAIHNNTSTLAIGGVGGNYIFTADLSGCLFAAYGPDAANITVEHVNVRDANAAVPIQPRATAIITGGFGFYKLLSPVALPGANGAHVKTYAANSSVVGVKIGGAWNFYYKPTIDSVALL